MFYTRLISTIALSPGLKERRRETWSSRIFSFVTGKGSSEEQEEEMVRLRDENQILSQQLEEINQSLTRLQKTKVELQDTQVQVQV